jgi:hypothetical protein
LCRYTPVRPFSARSPKQFEPGSVPLSKAGWGGVAGGGGYDGFADMAPSRWKDSVVTEAQVDKMADRLYGDAQRRQKAQSDAASRVSEECSVNSRWRTKKAASTVEEGFDRLFSDSKRWQKKSKVLPVRPVTGGGCTSVRVELHKRSAIQHRDNLYTVQVECS